jgi:hypothetical protein
MATFNYTRTVLFAELTSGALNIDVTGNGKPSGFAVAGTFSGATVKLQQLIGTTYVDLGSETTLTANGGGLFVTPIGSLRIAISGATAGFSVTTIIKPIEL